MEVIKSSSVRGGNVDGVLMLGNPTTEPGYYGNSLKLDGASAVNFGWARNGCFMSPDLCPNGFTASMWIYYPGGATLDEFFLSSGGHSPSSYGFTLMIKPMTGHVGIKTRTYFYHADFVMPTQRWSHVTVTWYHDAANPMDAVTIYVDSVSAASVVNVGADGYPGTSLYNLITFGSPNSNNDTNHFVQANIDEFLYWDEWKSASFVSDIYQHYTGQFVIFTSSFTY